LAIRGKGPLWAALELWDEGGCNDFSKDQTVTFFPYQLGFAKTMEYIPVYWPPSPRLRYRLATAFSLFFLSPPQIKPQGGAGEAVLFPEVAEEVALI
jgi:hypothetical protein